MPASVSNPLAAAVPARTEGAFAAPPPADGAPRQRAFRELFGDVGAKRGPARHRSGAPQEPPARQAATRTPAGEKPRGEVGKGGPREVREPDAEPRREPPQSSAASEAVGAVPGARRNAATSPSSAGREPRAGIDPAADAATPENLHADDPAAPQYPVPASEATQKPEAAPAGPFAGDGGTETEGYAEMLASAGALGGPAETMAPATASAAIPAPASADGEPGIPAAGGAIAALTAEAGATPVASGAVALVAAGAGGAVEADGRAVLASPGSPAGPATPNTGRASVPLVAGSADAGGSIPIDLSAIAAPGGEAGGMGIAEKLAAAKQPGASAGQPSVPLVRAGGGEAPARMPDAPANFGQVLSELALANGFTHRSGDLVGAFDRLVPGRGEHAGAGALRPTPVQMLPVEIGMHALRGATQFQIRLDPAELGRVEVTLEIREDGEVKANLVVDRVETLALLKREAPTLQQAFEQAGLRQNSDGLSFSLRGDNQHNQREERARGQFAPPADEEALRLGREIGEIAMRRVIIPHSSLDRVV